MRHCKNGHDYMPAGISKAVPGSFHYQQELWVCLNCGFGRWIPLYNEDEETTEEVVVDDGD